LSSSCDRLKWADKGQNWKIKTRSKKLCKTSRLKAKLWTMKI
jgi:hypothetical protein